MTDIAERVDQAHPTPEAATAFTVEDHGIDHVGESERRGDSDISIYVGLAVPFVGYLVKRLRRLGLIPDAALSPAQRSTAGPTGEAAPSQFTNLSNSGPA